MNTEEGMGGVGQSGSITLCLSMVWLKNPNTDWGSKKTHTLKPAED